MTVTTRNLRQTVVIKKQAAPFRIHTGGGGGSVGSSRTGKPIFILSTGQSEMTLHPAYAWSPEPNVYLWNFDGIVNLANVTGTTFAPMDATTMGLAYSYANEIAKANPLSKVYLVNIGIGAQAIAQWKVGASPSTLDMYAACKNNVQAALAFLGLSKIDKFLWLQGASDALAGSATYLADFETVIARFRAETWFPITTQIRIVGVSPYYGGLVTTFNSTLATAAAVEADVRKFIYLGALPITFWDAGSAYLHPTAAGNEHIGKLAYAASRANEQGVSVDPVTGAIGINQVPNPAYRVALTYNNNADAAALITNANAGASASGSFGVLTNAGVFVHIARSTAGGATAASYWSGTGNYQIIGGGGIRFMPAAADAAGFDTSGRFLVGSQVAYPTISTVQTQFQVHGLAAQGGFGFFNWGNVVGGGLFTFNKAKSGVVGTHAIVAVNDYLGLIVGAGSDGVVFQDGAEIRIQVDAVPGVGSMPTRVTVCTTPTGSVTPVERLRTDKDGAIIHRNNAQVIIDANSHHQYRTYTVATLPSAATAGQQIWCSDLGGGGGALESDGTVWKRLSHGGQETLATDADFTLTTLTNGEDRKHTGTLTANRAVTLSTTGAYKGARFRVTRTGGGAFTLTVAGKALATNQWAEAEYDGSAWYLAASGSL